MSYPVSYRHPRQGGFTLIELLAALLILSLLALMSYRGLGAVMDTREQVRVESEKWRHAGAFFVRFERDVMLAAPRPVRSGASSSPAWIGRAQATADPLLEFSRFSANGGHDSARRLGYRLNERREIELCSWPSLDVAPGSLPTRYPVLADVREFEMRYMDASLVWANVWPMQQGDPAIPLAVRVRIVLVSGEELVRVFALKS